MSPAGVAGPARPQGTRATHRRRRSWGSPSLAKLLGSFRDWPGLANEVCAATAGTPALDRDAQRPPASPRRHSLRRLDRRIIGRTNSFTAVQLSMKLTSTALILSAEEHRTGHGSSGWAISRRCVSFVSRSHSVRTCQSRSRSWLAAGRSPVLGAKVIISIDRH
jgi:hypothetical protein